MAKFKKMLYYIFLRSEPLREILEANLQEFMAQPLSVLVFTSPWCASCKKIVSSLDALSVELGDRVAFGICDISMNPNTPSLLQAFSVPTVIIFRSGEQVKKIQGSVSEKALLSAVKESLCH
jgi:thioredoxin 1